MESNLTSKKGISSTQKLSSLPSSVQVDPNYQGAYVFFPRRTIFQNLGINEDIQVPYTIEEIILLRKRIDATVESNRKRITYQTVTLLSQLFQKISLKMALLTLLRSKPIAAVKAIGFSIITLSVFSTVLNLSFGEPLISPYIILYLFFFGFLMSGMAILERAERRRLINKIK